MDNPRIDVKALRKARGWTQAQLAERVGVAQGTVSYWDNGTQPTAANAVRLAQALGCSVEDLYAYDPAGSRA